MIFDRPFFLSYIMSFNSENWSLPLRIYNLGIIFLIVNLVAFYWSRNDYVYDMSTSKWECRVVEENFKT